MKVLIIGSGGREHALAWAITRSPQRPSVFVAPGNAGTAEIAKSVPIPASDIDSLARFALEERVDLTVVGPEAPLTAGIVDQFRSRSLRIFGPDRRAARLEGSKAFAKDLMRRAGIATAAYEVFTSPRRAVERLREASFPRVIKADGLAAGKGVVIARDCNEAIDAVERMMVGKLFGSAGDQVLVEDFLEGEEISVFALCRGMEYVLLPTSQDHKRLLDGDRGPNTGGMGAYAPYPRWGGALEERVRRDVILPTLRALDAEGCPYYGLLYCGLIVSGGIPFVLEYNCRFGDPETQAVLPLITGDLLGALDAVASAEPGRLPPLAVAAGSAAVVTLASRGYPEAYEKGFPIRGIDEARARPGTLVFHSGTRAGPSGPLTDGGRVLGVVGIGTDLHEALARAYVGVGTIDFEGKTFRTDIGKRGLQP